MTKLYDRQAAVSYARRWALSRNPAYYDFDPVGGDCTNFTSQCLYAGAGVMDYTPLFGWYYVNSYDRTPSWTGVEYLYNFLVYPQKAAGPSGRLADVTQMRPGDVIELSFDGVSYRHCPFVLSVGETPAPENILVAAHSFNSLDRPLSTYSYVAARYIHIDDEILQ